MTQKHLWHLLLIIFVVVWSIVSMTPITNRDLMIDFQAKAKNKDAGYSNILARAQELHQQNPLRPAYGNLKEAMGTNDITAYFPRYNIKGQKEPSRYVLNRLQREAGGKVKLGLDLQGGSSFLVGLDTTQLSTNTDRTMAIEKAVEVLRKRVDRLGVAEPLLQVSGPDRIMIQLPGLGQAEMDEARRIIEKTAYLEFRIVHPESRELLAQNMVEPGYEVLKEESKDDEGNKIVIPYLVKRGAERGLNGTYVKRANFIRNHVTNEPEISFEMNADGAKIFADITREYSPKGNRYYLLAIVLDGELVSAPRIKEPIEGGRGVISGRFDAREAQSLANALENPLEAPVKILSENTVDPTLGADTIKSGVGSGIIGTVAVVVFMLVYYFMAGLVANIALMLNIVILMGVLCGIGTTLTMPGIAGIVLTIGMAVDANVLIFERIREELAAGKSLRGAVAAGYDKAFGTIFDSNLTTLISSVILIVMGSGPVKGFGVTLTIGILVSMFTALVVTRLIFDFLLAKNLLPSLKMLHLVRGAKFDFMKWAKPAFAASWLLILVGVGYGIVRGRDVLGVEFSGGDKITYAFSQKVGVEELRTALEKAQIGSPMIQFQRDLTSGKELLYITVRLVREAEASQIDQKVEQVLQTQFQAAKFMRQSVERVGAVVGAEIQRTAIVASMLALFGILVYVAFRYEFSFAVGAVIAIMHDILMTMGWFFLSGREMSGPFVAAILTIIGFSINDTIVIFDRIREDLKLGVRGSFRELLNHALNQTLSRTIITSGTVFLSTASLYLFGGGVVNDFAFTFLVGIITGTYSSIYIASAIVLWWHKGNRPNIGSGVAMESATSARAA
jgi:SecD/SecF fusion protein